MGMKKNIAASYLSQIYLALVGVLMFPLYLKHLGAEAFGLVGFFTLLQAIFNLFDIGITPTVARESARFHAGAMSALDYRRLLRALQIIFAVIAVIGGGVLLLAAPLVASKWLDASQLPLWEVSNAIRLMAIGIALRWMSGIYRAAIAGAEKIVWVMVVNASIATLRFVVILPVLVWIDATPATFFSYQVIVSAIELLVFVIGARRIFPSIGSGEIGYSFAPVKSVIAFSSAVAATATLWIFVTQIDKILMSNFLSLDEYGYFTLAVLAASGVLMASRPISNPLMPRLAHLEAKKEAAQALRIYRKATQAVAVIAVPATLLLVFFGREVVLAWTGDPMVASKVSGALSLYAVGNGFLALSAFPYYLQYAKGDLRLHLVGSSIFLLIVIPSVVYGARSAGSVGAGWAWALVNAAYFFLWTPLVHRRFVKGLHLKWLIQDVVRIAVPGVLVAWICSVLIASPASRLVALNHIAIAGLAITLAAMASSTAFGAITAPYLARVRSHAR